jgi:hypothetical protein
MYVPSDGINFLVDEMITERIKEGTNYEGVRVKVTALLGRMRRVLLFDIDMEIPKIQAYSKTTRHYFGERTIMLPKVKTTKSNS